MAEERSELLKRNPELELLTDADICALFQVSNVSAIRTLRKRGFPPGLRVGNETRWRKADVARWLDQQPGEPPTAPEGAAESEA